MIVTPSSLTGTWTLRRVDAVVVPGTLIQNDTVKIEVVSGSMTFERGRYDIRVLYRDTRTGGVAMRTDLAYGTFAVEAEAFVLRGYGLRSPAEAADGYSLVPVATTIGVTRGSITYDAGSSRFLFTR